MGTIQIIIQLINLMVLLCNFLGLSRTNNVDLVYQRRHLAKGIWLSSERHLQLS